MTETWQFSIMEATISLDLNNSYIKQNKPLEKWHCRYLFVKDWVHFWELASSNSDPETNHPSSTQSLLI